MRSTDGLVIGLLQDLAVTPGISRSGATITGGILRGLHREFAARFSLLISVPAILGATILEVSNLEAHTLPAFGPNVAGMIAAGLAGYAAISRTLHLVQQDRFYLFAWYLWPLGSLLSLGSYLFS